MSKIIQWINENKIGVMFMGGAIVISTAYGTCTLEPNITTGEDDAIQQVQPETEEAGSSSATEKEDN
ncbi:MAG TPA: hypothetical protein DCW74_05395 [Alteromonas australica]|uniref:Uncharacterized protein n=1 Tax=Alteromonas australica TaxID=589873 RepID=A0A350P1J1_9ALTE|nr:hypothetical protein [Alteromonas australica]|tara:strand:+ start:438 stop:638 length:201 start_codon:yes stop_codon:yes gene_type:complete